jgi:hypothetical protein
MASKKHRVAAIAQVFYRLLPLQLGDQQQKNLDKLLDKQAEVEKPVLLVPAVRPMLPPQIARS